MTTIDKIKEILNLSVEVKLEQQKLDNGAILEAEAFEPNKEVFIVTDDNRVPVPVGEYNLEDGKTLVIAEEGLISEIKEVEQESEEVVEENVEEDVEATPEVEMTEEKATPKKVVESITKEMFFSEIEKLQKEIDALKSEKVELNEQVNEDLQAELDKPAVEPISFNPENKQTLSKIKIGNNRPMSTLDRVMRKLSN
jgi:hypothetical protein